MLELPKIPRPSTLLDELQAARRARKMRNSWYRYHVIESDPQHLFRRRSVWYHIGRMLG